MHPRRKKLIAVLALPWLMLLYVGAVLAIADHLPDHWAVYLVFYLIAGTAWAFPLKPVMAWINRYPPAQ